MNAIIYTNEANANAANELLKELNHKPITYVGAGPFIEPSSKPYTNVIKHPTLNKWALISTPEIEEFLDIQSEELTSDWFTNNN